MPVIDHSTQRLSAQAGKVSSRAVMVVEGSIQFIVGDEVRTVRSGYSMLAPPGVAHKLVNNTWVSARMLIIRPTTEHETTHVE